MKAAQSGPAKGGDHCYDTALNLSAAKLDVYRLERLAYTEAPIKSATQPFFRRAIASLKAPFRFLNCLRKILFLVQFKSARVPNKRRS